MKLNFSIIIPNFNGAKFLETCLQSLLVSIKKVKDIQYEIILIDNASKDDSVPIFKNFIQKNQLFNTKLQILKINTGFANAVNEGINSSSYPWVILVNNDVTFDPDWFKWISKNLSTIDHNNLAAVFGTVLNLTGKNFESQGLKFYLKGRAENINNGKPYLPSKIDKLKPEFVWGASAALVIYQKEIIQKIALFDEDFFAYEEDVDLAYRLNLFNKKTLYIPQAISYHLGGGTSNQLGNLRYREVVKNWIYIIIKNYSISQLLMNFFPILEERLRNLSGLIKSTIKTYKLKSIYLLPYDLLRTYGEVLIKLPKMLKKRRLYQKLLKSTNL
jgi:GT2 family glycosyltransferase